MINCIIIEDEPIAQTKLSGYIETAKDLSLKGVFSTAIDGLNYLRSNSIDLVFLDIRMKGLSGIQFLESIKHKPKIIITSAYDEYAIKGYEFDVSDFLLKPFAFERFIKAVDKVHGELSQIRSSPDNGFIFIKVENKIVRVELDKILYIEGMKDYLRIVSTERNYMTLMSFSGVLELLPNSRFSRVHNSYVVSIDKIESIEKNRIAIKDQIIKISESYRESFFQILKNQNIIR
jgi:two-component system LytT family response regulator